jgi:hypothetical protein
MNKVFIDYFRCPDRYGEFCVSKDPSGPAGYFRFGAAIAYGRLTTGVYAETAAVPLHDSMEDVEISKSHLRLSFDPNTVVDNLRFERYVDANSSDGRNGLLKALTRNLYYSVRPALPVFVRKFMQKMSLKGWDRKPFPKWPVDRSVEHISRKLLALSMRAKGVDRIPFIWFWPEEYTACTIMTHDVETSAGVSFVPSIMDIEDSYGVKSSFQIVPEGRYRAPKSVLNQIRARGCEVNVHDLNHDGHLFRERGEFARRMKKVNAYRRDFEALGFRSGVLYRNLEWYDDLEFDYDMSVPNVGHLDPQPGGCCTVMPYFIGKVLELPLTTIQDYSLFHILGDYSIELWKKQIALILEENGLLSFNIHPDYVIPSKARRAYIELLSYLQELCSAAGLWVALPCEVNRWWRQRAQMELVCQNGCWQVEGLGSERARVAFASLEGDRLTYTIQQRSETDNSWGRGTYPKQQECFPRNEI